jgi:hypothetical protein
MIDSVGEEQTYAGNNLLFAVYSNSCDFKRKYTDTQISYFPLVTLYIVENRTFAARFNIRISAGRPSAKRPPSPAKPSTRAKRAHPS